WADVWRRYRKRKLSLLALIYVVLMFLVAVLSPAIAGTKPVVVKYKGEITFPALGYFRPAWEDGTKVATDMRKRYSPVKLKERDPQSWAIWPLVFQDPYRRVRAEEWPG